MVCDGLTTSASTAPCTSRRMRCPTHCAVPRVSRSCEHFPDGFDLHLLPSVLTTLSTRLQAKKEHLERLEGFLPESQGQNLALTVLYVLDSLGCGIFGLRLYNLIRIYAWIYVYVRISARALPPSEKKTPSIHVRACLTENRQAKARI